MKTVLASLLLAGAASAHTIFSELAVNGVWQGNYKTSTNGIRLPTYDGPIQDVTDSHMACNGYGQNTIVYPSKYKVPVKAGDTISLKWLHALDNYVGDSDTANPVDPGHKGPISVYMAKVSDALGPAPTSGWFKIYEDGLTSDGKWAVDRLYANKGIMDVKIPECLAPGDYLFRGELIALHGAGNVGGVQVYMECAQLTVSSSGSTVPSNTVSFPGAYSPTDPGILINIYYPTPTSYAIPGPRPFTCGTFALMAIPSNGDII
ncbi:hypothetical protein HDV00_007210 [Rhizophlyctis rosea]|nr:hypothetical protein HDV00_007210 [Rhizophlyctis rosea]